MSVKLVQNAALCTEKSLSSEKHILFILTEKQEDELAFGKILHTKLNRISSEYKNLNKTPLILDLPNNGVASYVI